MPTIEDVLTEWKQDNRINDSQLNKELMATPMLHSKYLDYYVFFKGKLTVVETKYRKMAYLRKRYYRGELTKEELQTNGWEQYQGLKMSNSEFNQQEDIDPVLADLTEKVNYYKTAVASLEYIMKSIQSREYTLKTLFEFMKYTGGG